MEKQLSTCLARNSTNRPDIHIFVWGEEHTHANTLLSQFLTYIKPGHVSWFVERFFFVGVVEVGLNRRVLEGTESGVGQCGVEEDGMPAASCLKGVETKYDGVRLENDLQVTPGCHVVWNPMKSLLRGILRIVGATRPKELR